MNATATLGVSPHDQKRASARSRILAGLPVAERRLELAGIPTAVLVIDGAADDPAFERPAPAEENVS